MNERAVSSHHNAGINRRVELEIQSVLAATGALVGAAVAAAAATHLGIESDLIFALGLLAASIGTALGVASAPRVAATLRW